jgi:hypothetical protein
VLRGFGHVEPTDAGYSHRADTLEALFSFRVRGNLSFGSHGWARLKELLSPLRESRLAEQRHQVHALSPHDLYGSFPNPPQ